MSITAEPSEYRFTQTQDWFSGHIPTWTSLFPLVKSSDPKILEIGSWEGRSAVFVLNSQLCASGGSITCIDHFDQHKTREGRQRWEKIQHNLKTTGKPFRILEEFSVPALMLLLEEAMTDANPGFDWVYIDGSHEADDTFLDGELAWRLARNGAIVIFDDYDWNKEPKDGVHHPKRGIDAFMKLHEGQFEVISSGYQMILQKTSKIRIGFVTKGKEGEGALEKALGYGIHIALTIDSAYAMPAAVTIRSVVETTASRVTCYIIDCGLKGEDRARLQSSLPEQHLTLVFIPLKWPSFAKEMGAVWAKIDLIKLLPVERVLYLDADTLIRADLNKLWGTDLTGKSIGAVQDVGFPLGHPEMDRAPYFNAGVLLMDLAKIRERLGDLERVARKMFKSRYLDQDALNKHFRGDWLPLNLRWNAQGLGTYADIPSPDRDMLCLTEMEDAAIVHFTGPVSPHVEHVLNPYLQPCTSKPWGYLGAPGHPYAQQWWEMLEKTAWSPEWKKSHDYIEWRKEEIDRVKRAAMTKFDIKVDGRKN